MSRCSAILVALCTVLPTLAQAQTSDITCDDRTRLTHTLSHVLGAEIQGMGLRGPETMLEVWVTRTSGDWMIVHNYANGTSCIVAMGQDWEGPLPGPA